MKSVLITAVVLFIGFSCSAQDIVTVAGTGGQGYNGDTIPALTCEFDLATGIAFDKKGNLYVCDFGNGRVRKIDSAGIITTIAGTDTSGYNGDNIPATKARLYDPYDLAFDKHGNLYISDLGNDRIRKVDTNGIITTVAGTGVNGYNKDSIPATQAYLNMQQGIAFDAAGNLYIADANNQRIRKVDTAGIITTIAGTGTLGYNGDNIAAVNAQLKNPGDVTIDTAGNIFIADTYSHRVRKIDRSGIIHTIAGNGIATFGGDGGPAINGQFWYPSSIAFDTRGNLFITDANNSRIRKINTGDTISTVAGNGTQGHNGDSLPALATEIYYPLGIAFNPIGNLFYSEYFGNRIRKVGFCTAANVPEITQQGNDTLKSTAALSYQWFYNGNIITGASSQIYIASKSGSYKVHITDAAGCSNFSSLHSFAVAGIKEVSAGTISVYPNPSSGQFIVNLPFNTKEISVTNMMGQVIIQQRYTTPLQTTNFKLNMNGAYFLRITTEKESIRKEIMVQN